MKGVYHDRELNDCNLDYSYVGIHESQGIRLYMHKYFLGLQAYYQKAKHEDFYRENAKVMDGSPTPKEFFQAKNEFSNVNHKFDRDMKRHGQSMVFRATLLFRDERKTLKSVSGPESLFDPDYTGNHIVIFENQLTTPHNLTQVGRSYGDYTNLRKMNFKDWRIVDVDHFMKGNSFFNKQVP